MKIRRGLYLMNNAFEAWLAVAAMVTCLTFFTDPAAAAQSSVGRSLGGPWDDAWNIAYGVSGLLILLGLGIPRLRIELMGLLLFAAAVAGNTVAVLDIRGFGQAVLLLAITIATLLRVWSIVRIVEGDRHW